MVTLWVPSGGLEMSPIGDKAGRRSRGLGPLLMSTIVDKVVLADLKNAELGGGVRYCLRRRNGRGSWFEFPTVKGPIRPCRVPPVALHRRNVAHGRQTVGKQERSDGREEISTTDDKRFHPPLLARLRCGQSGSHLAGHTVSRYAISPQWPPWGIRQRRPAVDQQETSCLKPDP